MTLRCLARPRRNLAFLLAVSVVATGFAPRHRVESDELLVLGAGEQRFEWVRGWGGLPDGADYGNTHGCIVVDRAGTIYANTDTSRAIVKFDADGKYLGHLGEAFAGGLHGMDLVVEDGKEFLYLAHIGQHRVYKVDLEGNVLLTIGYPARAGMYTEESQFRPTGVAVDPDGNLFVADGYGLSWVHKFDRQGEYIKSFGGRGSEPGQMQTPHGIFLDPRGEEPTLIVADRENHRLQVFDLEGKLLRVVEGMLRRPCNVDLHGDELVVADLAGRVTLLGPDFELLTHLGDNPDEGKRAQNGVPRDQWKDGEFISPHGAAYDDRGDLYVMDWLAPGRLSKLRRAVAGR